MAVIQTTESAASRLARKLPPAPNAGSAARRLAAKLPPAPTPAPAAQPDPYAKYQVQPGALVLGDGLNNPARRNAFPDPQIDPNNYGPEIEQAAKSITPQEIADLRAYAKASGGSLDGQPDESIALVAARMKLQPNGVMQRRGPTVIPQGSGVAATSPLGQMARAIPGVRQARDFAYGAAQGGISQTGSGISSVLGTASGLAGFDNAAALFHEAANQINAQAPQGTGAAFKLGGVAGQVLPAVSAAATGGATSPLVMGLLSTASFGSGVQEYRNALLSRGETPTPGGELTVGLGFAAVEYLTERIGLDSALRRVPGLSDSLRAFRTSPTPAVAAKLLDDLAPVMVANAGEEMAAQVGQNAIAKAKYDPNRDITAGTLEAGLLGAAGGSMIALPGAAVNALGAGLDAYEARRMMQAQQLASAPQSPVQAQVAPTDTTLDDAAALAEQRISERYNPAPVGQPSPADQVASSRPEQGNGDQATASVLRDLGITPEDFAQRVEEARVNQYRANPQQAYLDGKITREQLAAFLEERVAADPGEQLRRQAEARATGPQREMRRVDRNARLAVAINPNATVPQQQQRRVPDVLGIEEKANKITEVIGKGWILDRRFGLMDRRQQEDMIRAGERLDPIWGETIRPEADPDVLARLGIARQPQQTPQTPNAPQGRADSLSQLLGMDSEADAQRYANSLSPSERQRLGLPQRAPEGQRPATTDALPSRGPTPVESSDAPAAAPSGAEQPSRPASGQGRGGQIPQGSSPSPQSTREPWQMTRGEYASSANVLPQRKERLTDFFPEKGARGFIPGETDPDALFFERRNMRAAVDVGGRIFVGPTTHTSAMEAAGIDPMGPNFQKQYEDVIPGFVHEPTGTWFDQSSSEAHKKRVLRAHAANKPVPPEVLAEYGLKSPESPDSSNDSESPKGSTAKDTPKYGVYPQAVKGRGTMFAVRESDNPNGYGDTIHATREEAEKYAKEIEDRDRRNAESRERDRAAQEAKDREEAKRKAERENTRGFADSMPPMQRGKAIASLNTLVRVGGEADTIKSHVEKMVGAGGVELATREEPKIKPMGRTEYNRASQREQEAHEKRMKEAGTKTVYTVNGYDLGKTAFDYATFLKANPQPQGQVAATTNKEPKNGEEAKAPQAQVLNAGTAAPVSAGVVGAKTKAKATADDIPMDVANRAFSGTSHVPEKRARTWQSYYVNDFNNLAERFRKLADTDELRAALEEELTRFQEGLKSKYLAYLGAHSRVMSSMITGPARFPVEANRKRMDSADKRLAEIVEFVKRAEKAITRKLFPQASGVIRSDDENAPDALRAKIEGLQRRQEAMKDANKIIRKGGEPAAMVPKLEALGFSNDEARRVLFPQFQRGMGFPGYALTNNSKNIRRLQERLTQIESQRAREPRTATFPGGRVVENADAQRVQITFPGKPDEATREKLKSRGFKWAPSEGAWQRLMNESGWRAALQVTGATQDAKAPAQTENDDAIDPAEIAAEVARMKAMDPDTIPQENADGTGTGTTGGVGAARVNRQGAREGQQAEDAGNAPKPQGAKRGGSRAFSRADIERRLGKILSALQLDRTAELEDYRSEEQDNNSTGSQFSMSFGGDLPAEIRDWIDANKFFGKYFKTNQKFATGEDALARLGLDKYIERVLEIHQPSKIARERARLLRGQSPEATMLVWLLDRLEGGTSGRAKWKTVQASTLKDGQTFQIDGVNFEVMPNEEDQLSVVQRGPGGEAIDNAQAWELAALTDIPVDADTLGQADNTGEVPDIAPEQVTTEGDDADAMLGRIKEQLDRGSGRQSADMIRAFQELGSTLVPGVRLQDAEEVGRMYAMLDDGTVTLAEYTNYIDDLRKSGKVAKPEPVAPTPEQATTEKPKFSDSEGVFGQKTESITGSQTSMFGNIAPDVTPDATRYPGIRSGETVAEYEKRMGTTDTPDMFGGPSSTGGDPRSPNYRPDLNDRISDALGRWSAAARSRFDERMGKIQRGELLGSGVDPTPLLDLAASFAFRALQAGVTSKSGRKLTAFVEGRMADVRAKWPQLNVTTEQMRKSVRKMLAAAGDDKTKIIPAYAEARERLEKARTKQAGKTLGDPKAVREAVASATAERPDVAAKIIDVVKRGIRQGKEAGILTATAQIQPLIDRARRATQASKRAREMDKIEARGAVESVKAEAEARAEERRGIRAEAVRLVQDTPIAGRGKYLSAVANAKTMKDLSKVLGRLRRDLAKSVGNQFAKVAAQLKKQERTLNEDRRLEATKAWAAVAANLDTLKNHKASTEELEQAAQNIREAAEALRSIFHGQKNADKVQILGRAITAQEHRDEMVKRLEMRKQLPQSDTPGQPRDKAWLRQKFDKFLNFHSMMMALDQEFYGNGPFARAWRAMSERRTAELAKNQEFADRADKIARKYGYKGLAEFIAKSSGALGDASQQWIDVELGEFKRITLGQALDIYARDAETREKMHKRQRFTFDPEGGSGSFIINDAKIAQIENALTKQQKQLAREMNRLRSEMQFDRMNETYKTLTGNYLVQVPEHYPIRRAMKLSESPDITKGLGEWTIKKMEEAGYLKQRVGGSAPIVIGDFATTQLRQFQMAESFIQRGTIVKYLGATLLHPDVRVPIVQRHGTKIMDRVQQTISEFSGNESPQQDRMLRKLMSNVARAQTQVNVGTWARNMATAFNVPLAIVDGKMLGVRKTLRGILAALRSHRKTMQILMRHSPDLRHRWSHAGASISLMHGTDVQASTDIADTAFSDAAKGTIRQILSALKGIKAGKFLSRTADVSRPWNQLLDAIKLGNVFDGFGAMVAYHAVRADAPASLSPNAADKWAVRRAASIFAQTANTNDLLNSNDWQLDARRSTWTAGILAFTSDIAKKQNLLYLATKRGKKATAYATAAVTLGALWSTAITAAISAAVGDDEDKIKMRAAEGMAKELVSLMPAGTLTSNVLEMVMNPRGSSGILDTPLTAVSKNVLAAVKKFADAADDGEEADVFEGAYRVLRVLNDVTGAPIGPTAGMVKRAIVNYGTE